jgi:hypothetical protein
MANLKHITRDGQAVTKLQCPKCGIWGDIDDDQLHGRISVDCPECDYHETHNWKALAERG